MVNSNQAAIIFYAIEKVLQGIKNQYSNKIDKNCAVFRQIFYEIDIALNHLDIVNSYLKYSAEKLLAQFEKDNQTAATTYASYKNSQSGIDKNVELPNPRDLNYRLLQLEKRQQRYQESLTCP